MERLVIHPPLAPSRRLPLRGSSRAGELPVGCREAPTKPNYSAHRTCECRSGRRGRWRCSARNEAQPRADRERGPRDAHCHLRVHRGLLQSAPAPLIARVYVPARLREATLQGLARVDADQDMRSTDFSLIAGSTPIAAARASGFAAGWRERAATWDGRSFTGGSGTRAPAAAGSSSRGSNIAK
jgi:hypothetical protein